MRKTSHAYGCDQRAIVCAWQKSLIVRGYMLMPYAMRSKQQRKR